MFFAGERSVETFQAGVLFIDCKAVPAVEIQGGFPVGTGFQGDLIAMEFPGDIRGFPEERGSIPPAPVIGMGNNVLNDREGADIVSQAPDDGHLDGGNRCAVFLSNQDLIARITVIFGQELFPDGHVLLFPGRVFGQVIKIHGFQRFGILRFCFTNDHGNTSLFSIKE